MEKKYTRESLKEAIMMLEIEHAEKGRQLKEELIITYNNLNPINIIKNAISDISISPDLKNSLIDTAVGITTGFITKKLLVGTSSSKILKFAGILIQYGLTTIVTRNYESIKNSIVLFLKQYTRQKE